MQNKHHLGREKTEGYCCGQGGGEGDGKGAIPQDPNFRPTKREEQNLPIPFRIASSLCILIWYLLLYLSALFEIPFVID